MGNNKPQYLHLECMRVINIVFHFEKTLGFRKILVGIPPSGIYIKSHRRLKNREREKGNHYRTIIFNDFIGVVYFLFTIIVPSVIQQKPQKSAGNTEFSWLSCGFVSLIVLLCNINVLPDGKDVQCCDRQSNATGQCLPYYPSPVTSSKVTLTCDDQSFMSAVIVRSHFLRWQL